MDDLISRKVAIKWFFRPYSSEELYSNIDVERALNAIPSVDAAPVVHAHWVEEPDRVNHWHCSNCGLTVGMASLAYRYCYACGAKIDDKKKETIVNE